MSTNHGWHGNANSHIEALKGEFDIDMQNGWGEGKGYDLIIH